MPRLPGDRPSFDVIGLAAAAIAGGLPPGPLSTLRFVAAGPSAPVHALSTQTDVACRPGRPLARQSEVSLTELGERRRCQKCFSPLRDLRNGFNRYETAPWVQELSIRMQLWLVAAAHVGAAQVALASGGPENAAAAAVLIGKARRTHPLPDARIAISDPAGVKLLSENLVAAFEQLCGDVLDAAAPLAAGRNPSADVVRFAGQVAVTEVYEPGLRDVHRRLGPKSLPGTAARGVHGKVEHCVFDAGDATKAVDVLLAVGEPTPTAEYVEKLDPQLAQQSFPSPWAWACAEYDLERRRSAQELVDATLARRSELIGSTERRVLVLPGRLNSGDDATVSSVVATYGIESLSPAGRPYVTVRAVEAVVLWLWHRTWRRNLLLTDDPEQVAAAVALWSGTGGDMRDSDEVCDLVAGICS